jgi:hypothetical protein
MVHRLKNKVTDVPLKFSNFMKNEKETVNMSICRGMRKIFTKGIKQANKVMLLSAVAYNLKKYLKFTQKRVESKTQTQVVILSALNSSTMAYFMCSKAFIKMSHI